MIEEVQILKILNSISGEAGITLLQDIAKLWNQNIKLGNLSKQSKSKTKYSEEVWHLNHLEETQ